MAWGNVAFARASKDNKCVLLLLLLVFSFLLLLLLIIIIIIVIDLPSVPYAKELCSNTRAHYIHFILLHKRNAGLCFANLGVLTSSTLPCSHVPSFAAESASAKAESGLNCISLSTSACTLAYLRVNPLRCACGCLPRRQKQPTAGNKDCGSFN